MSAVMFYSVGASSAVDALVMASIALFPRARLQLFAYTAPVPAAAVGMAYFALDCAGMVDDDKFKELLSGKVTLTIDSNTAGHVAAGALGLITGLYFRRYFR